MYVALVTRCRCTSRCTFPASVPLARTAVHRFGIPLLISVPVVWVGLEYLRATLMTGFAWYFLRAHAARVSEITQVSDLVGAYKQSFIVAIEPLCLAGLVPASWLNRLKLFPPVKLPDDYSHLSPEGLAENCSRADFQTSPAQRRGHAGASSRQHSLTEPSVAGKPSSLMARASVSFRATFHRR